jgi:anti-sigma regulatory factor (Ser/Thr protein kinase)
VSSESLDPEPVAAHEADAFSAFVELPMDSESAHQARHTVRELLTTWRVDDLDLRHDVLLLTSELVTNAVRHGAHRVVLHVTLKPELIEVAVEDGSPVLPPSQAQSVDDLPGQEGGRGVLIISAVASNWGVDEVPGGGKRVWAQVQRAPSLPDQRTP